VRLALLIALTSSALAFLPILGSRLARLLADYAWSHGARRSRAGAGGRARPPWAPPAVTANLGVGPAPPPQTKQKRFSRSPVMRPRLSPAGGSLRRPSRLVRLLRKTAEVIVVVGLGLVLGAAIGILALLYGS
jgi:hypothetical protein